MKKYVFLSLIICLGMVFTLSGEQKTFNNPKTGESITMPRKGSSPADWKRYHDYQNSLYKTLGRIDRASGIHKGNRVRTLFYNYGTIGKPQTEPSLEWPIGSNEGYGFEFGVIVGSKVRVENGTYKHILSESLTGGDKSPGGASWGWEPLPGYNDPSRSDVAMSTSSDINQDGKPDSWPPAQTEDNKFWYSINDPEHEKYPGFYAWPGEYGHGVTTADEESYWIMNDYYNKEFNRTDFDYPSIEEDTSEDGTMDEIYHSDISDNFYYPDTTDMERGGIGLRAECRGYQWAHTLAQDCIFFIYEFTNVGTEDLDNAIFGMFGDPHVGGANDYSDDDASYDTKIDMVYAWDHDFQGETGYRPGYFGYKFLESPGEPNDGKDNDEDGMLNESMQDGIDNDGDWLAYEDYNGNGVWDEEEPLNDDLGTDGLGPKDGLKYPGPDEDGTQGNGQPDPGESNFDQTDLDEADQIGLTAFSVITYGAMSASNDEAFYNMMNSAIEDSNFAQNCDNVYLYSSGPIKLYPNNTRRFSIAVLFGYDQADLFHSAGIVQQIYNAGYRFVKAPEKPRVTSVAGDGEVTLYWDDRSEFSRDPVYGYDFEGYAIYRSTDYGFNDPFNITDAQGNPKLWEPIARFDIDNHISGPHEIEQTNGIHYYMGDNTGLQHSFTDTTVMNGRTYYYAVVAYDSGSVKNTVPPTECTKNIEKTVTGDIRLDDNTAMVTPQAPAAGYEKPDYTLSENNTEYGGTGKVNLEIIDPTEIKNDQDYKLQFLDTSNDTIDNDDDGKIDSLDIDELARNTVSYSLLNVTDPDNQKVLFENSQYLNGEDRNPYIDGLKIQVWNDEIEIDYENTGWVEGNCNYDLAIRVYKEGGGVAFPSDFELTVADQVVSQDALNNDCQFTMLDLTEQDTADYILFKSEKGKIIDETEIIPAVYLNGAPKGTWKYTFNSRTPSVQAMFRDNAGNLWFGSDGGGLTRYASQKWKRWESTNDGIESKVVTCFAESQKLSQADELKTVFIGTKSGLNLWNGYEMLNVQDLKLVNNHINALITDADGDVWAGTNEGIIFLRPGYQNQQTIENIQFTNQDSVPSNTITALYRDSENKIWIGTDAGISVYDNGNWSPTLENINVNDFVEWSGQVYVATDKGLYRGSQLENVGSTPISDNIIYALEEYQSALYVAVNGSDDIKGLYKTDDGSNFDHLSVASGELTDDDVISLYHDEITNKLYAGNINGLDYYSEDEGWASYNPEPGDRLRISTKKPFSHLDVYRFNTDAAQVAEEKAKKELDDIAVVPNPYVATAVWEPKPDFVTGRGERRIYFINLPNKGTIRIFTVNGELVKTIPIENNIFNGAVSWNLLNEDNLEIAYGVYVYHVETEDYGTKIGKFAIVK